MSDIWYRTDQLRALRGGEISHADAILGVRDRIGLHAQRLLAASGAAEGGQLERQVRDYIQQWWNGLNADLTSYAQSFEDSGSNLSGAADTMDSTDGDNGSVSLRHV